MSELPDRRAALYVDAWFIDTSQPREALTRLFGEAIEWAREEGRQEERWRCVSIATKAGYGKYAAEIVDDLWSLIVKSTPLK